MSTVNANNASNRSLAHSHPRSVSAPSAGSNLTYTPANYLSTSLILLGLTFTADANAANRFLTFEVSLGSTFVPIGSTNSAITANDVVQVCFAQGITDYETNAGAFCFVPLPCNLWLKPGAQLRIAVTNIQVGDAFSDVLLWEDLLHLT